MGPLVNATMNPVRNCSVIDHALQEELILYHVEREEIHILNPTACLIWTYCDGQHDLDRLTAAIYRAYDGVDGTKIAHDVLQTIAQFRSKGLLQPAEAAARGDFRRLIQSVHFAGR